MTATPASAATHVCFVNHASLLIRRAGRYLLTDPWHQKPAFGSWLPTFPQYMHPAYLAALGSRLSVLISHGHDDHCDDDFLSLLHKDTQFVTAKFGSPSVINRLKRLGFENVLTADAQGTRLPDGFFVKAYISPDRSLDDATYTIHTGDGLVIHCNDNWNAFDPGIRDDILRDRNAFDDHNVMLLSQSNSASGYPLNYSDIPANDKVAVLRIKVRSMVLQGLRNTESLSLTRMFSYAGFASVFVEGKPEYNTLGMLPTARFLKDELLTDPEAQAQLRKVDIAEYYPGDVIDLGSGALIKAFIDSTHYGDDAIKAAAGRYYQQAGAVGACDTYSTATPAAFDAGKLRYFLDGLGSFVLRKLDTDAGAFKSVLGKSFEIHVIDVDVRQRLVFGKGAVAASDAVPPNKRLSVRSDLLARVLDGELLFENLYTGYEGEWQRFPSSVYNRDIVMFLVMYSYLYKNRLASIYRRADAATP